MLISFFFHFHLWISKNLNFQIYIFFLITRSIKFELKDILFITNFLFYMNLKLKLKFQSRILSN